VDAVTGGTSVCAALVEDVDVDDVAVFVVCLAAEDDVAVFRPSALFTALSN